MKLNQKQVQHFFLRAGFGQQLDRVKASVGKTAEDLFKQLMAQSHPVAPVKIDRDFVSPSKMKDIPRQERQQMMKEGREAVKELNVKWMKEMVLSDAQLREKMAFFWHDHFACRSQHPLFMQGYLDVIREHALGNFGELLRAVSRTPAMLKYLNNKQNRKASPNENFAREVMELFTLGRDQGYTEQDISEAARAFTGWSFDKEGQFVFKRNQHDQGQKTVLGQTDTLTGDDVIDILLKSKQTARYISQKWVRFFMNYDGDEQLEQQIADELYQTNYDIQSVLKILFTSPIFFKKQNIGRRIKSPIELIVGMQRQLHSIITHDLSLIYLQKTLGQTLFDPPNVAGWSDGVDWVDSATLMFRVNLPQLVFKSALIENSIESFDDNDNFKIRGKLKKLETELDVRAMNSSFGHLEFSDLADYLLQAKLNTSSPQEDFIDQIIYITSKPEYQLC